jgi:hypothetical protein
MRCATSSFRFALIATCLTLSGCYETATPVLGPGVEVPIAPGAYRCRNPSDRDEGAVTISAPARIGADDVVHVVTVDKHRYAVRAAAISGDLHVLEARGGDVRATAHVFVRRTGVDGFDLMATHTRAQDRLLALARTHGVAITFGAFGMPAVDGPPDRLRAFFMAHTLAELERTSSCRRAS